MDEAGFDFTGHAERREPKPFVPPPWEAEHYEVRDTQAPVPVEPVTVEQVAEQVDEGSGAQGEDTKAESGHIDEAVLTEMLSQLASEEEAGSGHYEGVQIGVGIGLMAFGLMMVVWGMAALVETASAGLVGSFAGVGIALLGAFFFGVGGWLVYRTLRRRGVL